MFSSIINLSKVNGRTLTLDFNTAVTFKHFKFFRYYEQNIFFTVFLLVFCTSPRLEKRTWFDRHGIKVLSVFYLSGLVFMFSPVIYGIYTGSRKNEKNEIYQVVITFDPLIRNFMSLGDMKHVFLLPGGAEKGV